MTLNRLFSSPFILLALWLSGCSIGRNSTLFVTKSNVGFEASSKPPTLQLALSRKEGVVGPQFQDGQKLPVMASFRFGNQGAFAPSVGSSFATGDAASTLAALYGDKTPSGDWTDRSKLVKENQLPSDSALILPSEPKVTSWLPDWNWLNKITGKPTFQKDDVRPVFFGTDTALGVKVSWSGMTGSFPDSANFGYNRKELALVPISMKPSIIQNADGTTSATYSMKMSSLLATVDSGVTGIQNPDGTPALNLEHLQYFATGHAATLLSLQSDVRKAMLARLDPNAKKYKKLFGTNATESGKSVAFNLLQPIYLQLKRENTPEASSLADGMDKAVPRVTGYDFLRYQYSGTDLSDTTPIAALGGAPFIQFHAYYSNLEQSIKNLQEALVDQNLATFNGKAIQDLSAERADILQKITALTAKQHDLLVVLQKKQSVFNDAVDYFYR
jgi:hypothetical protein